jgi:hypothetical protein
MAASIRRLGTPNLIFFGDYCIARTKEYSTYVNTSHWEGLFGVVKAVLATKRAVCTCSYVYRVPPVGQNF